MKEGYVMQLRAEQQPPNQRVLQLIWGAFMGAVCVYALVGYVIRPLPGQSPTSEALSFMVPIFGGLAAIQTALIFAWGRLFASADYQTYSVIRWALAEAVAVYGLVFCFLGASETTSGAFFGWALLSLFRLRPSAEDYQRFLGLKGQKTNHKSP